MARTPVVFVPGLGGSFNLLALLDWSPPSLSGWDFPPFLDYGHAFVDAFTHAGYSRNRELFVAFYDWRKSVADSATNYLIPWIDRAKTQSGSAKVILIGHSMGGLVARSYIQSTAYRNDVERLITLGTPHRGALDAYYPWQGGDMNWGPLADAVFGVYLWYLEHAHPFQTKLNRLLTIRTQAPGVRDLLPVFDYLQRQGAAGLTPAAKLQQRNLLSDFLLAPAPTAQLLARAALTTINGTGFATMQSLVVGDPPGGGDPPLYIDGLPIEKRTSNVGDGTVLLSSATVDTAGARNLPALPIAHDDLPDRAVAQIMAELNITPPPLPARPAPATRLVILSASPLEFTVEPLAPAAVLSGSGPRPRRGQRVRAKNYGHRGKHLNMAIIADPASGAYRVRVSGVGTGPFALGALIVGPQGPRVLSDDQAQPMARATPISTVHGQVAAATELQYQVEYVPGASAPQIRFDAAATASDALERLSAAVQTIRPRVLGDDPGAPVLRVLADANTAAELRDLVAAALLRTDAAARGRLTARLVGADQAALQAIADITIAVAGPSDQQLALGLLEQLRQVALA